jgi:hypothetical protein
MANEDILIALKEAVRAALCETANNEIKKRRDQFENEMNRAKREVVCNIVNQIQIVATHTLPEREYVIQLKLHGGK